MSEELDEYKSEQFNREQEAYSAIEKQFEDVNRKLNSFFNLFLTGELDSVFVEMMADRDKFHSGDLWIHGIGQRVSYLEMKAGRRIDLPQPETVTDKPSYAYQRSGSLYKGPYPELEIKTEEHECQHGTTCVNSIPEPCNCPLSGPDDFQAEPDCPRHGNPKVLAQLDQPNTNHPPIYVVKDINNVDQTREYIRSNECHLNDEQVLEIMTRMGMMIEPPAGIKRPNSYSAKHVDFEMDLANRLKPLYSALERIEYASKKLLGVAGTHGFGMRCGYDAAAEMVKQVIHNTKSTMAEQSESYSKSAQSEPSPQYEERQSSSHYQCKYRHGQTVATLLAHMGSTSESDPPEALERVMEQFCRTWLALWKCEEVECQAARRLVAQALSSQLLE